MTKLRQVNQGAAGAQAWPVEDTALTGEEGADPPAILGSGVLGWLRAIYDRLTDRSAKTRLTDGANDVAVDPQGPSLYLRVHRWGGVNVSQAGFALDDSGFQTTGPMVRSFLHFYNGDLWDRARGDIANGLDVDVTRSALPQGAATSALQEEIKALLEVSRDLLKRLGPLTYTVLDDASVTSAAADVVAAGGTGVRVVVISVPPTATAGIRINTGADATATSFLFPPGEKAILCTNQRVSAIRAGAANVTVSRMTAVPA